MLTLKQLLKVSEFKVGLESYDRKHLLRPIITRTSLRIALLTREDGSKHFGMIESKKD